MYPEKKPELYGGDAFLLGKSPGEEQFKQAMGTLQPIAPAPGIRGQEGAEGQLWQGIQQQQQLSQAMASRRGYNPLAARAATASGAEMESQGYGAAQGIRAGEEAQRRAQQLQAYQARSAYDQAMAQLGQQQFKGSLERQLYEDAMQRGIAEQKRAKERAEQEGWMSALSGGMQLAGDIINAASGGGAIGSDPSMKQNVGYGGDDVDRAMALFNPTGAKPDGGMGAKLGGMLKGASGILKGGMGGGAQIPGAGGVPIKDAELFNWSAQQSGQSVDPNMLKAAMASGGTLQGAPAAAGAGFNLGSIGGLLGGILSDPSMKQNIADGSEAVDNALYTREPFEGDAVARIRSLYGERGEQPIGNAILEETGEYGSATNPRTATMYLGDLPTGARMVQAPGVQNEIAAIGKQLDEMTPFEQMIALNRGKAVPTSERLASAGEAIGAASVAADPRLQQIREPLGSLKGMGVELQDIGEGGPANTITRVEADPRSVRRTRGEIMLPEVTLRDTPYTVAQRNAPQIAAALQQLDVPMQRGLTTGRVEMPTSFASELLDYQKKKQQNALAAQLAQKAEADREAAVNTMSTDDIIKAYGDELLNTAEQSIMQTGGVDVQGVLGTPLPKDVGKKVDDTMNNVVPKRFEYKEGAKQDAAERGISTPEGTNVGVMTSDLRKSKLGRSIVNPTDIGDTIDPAKAVSLSLAAAARNNQKLRELEAKMNKRNA